MNLKKISNLLFVSALLCGSTMHASEQALEVKVDKESLWNSKAAKLLGVAAGIFMIYKGGQYCWNKFYGVEAKIDGVQKTCKKISTDQKMMSSQIKQVDTRVKVVDLKVDTLQIKADTLLRDQKKVGQAIQTVKEGVDANGQKITYVATRVESVESSLSQLHESTKGQHATQMESLDKAHTQLRTIETKIVDKGTVEQFMCATASTLTDIRTNHDSHYNQIQNCQNDHAADLKEQHELLVANSQQLEQLQKTTNKVQSKADRTKRRIKSLFKCVKKTDPEMEDVSDSDEESQTNDGHSGQSMASKTTLTVQNKKELLLS